MHAHSQERLVLPEEPAVSWEEQRVSLYQSGGKRVFETCLVLLVLPLALVALAGSCLLILVCESRPVLYWQTRTGRHGRPFRMCKLRTMRTDAEAGTGAIWALPDDPRTTRCGRLLRSCYLDELPQLFQVLTGTMSLIGPRPERPELIRWLREVLPGYEMRLRVRPGITGWAQVHRGADACIDDVAAKLAYDLEYAADCTLGRDLRILLGTVGRIMTQLVPARWRPEAPGTRSLTSQDAL